MKLGGGGAGLGAFATGIGPERRSTPCGANLGAFDGVVEQRSPMLNSKAFHHIPERLCNV